MDASAKVEYIQPPQKRVGKETLEPLPEWSMDPDRQMGRILM